MNGCRERACSLQKRHMRASHRALGEMVTDADLRLCALEIASLSAQLADMANETGNLRRPLATMAVRLAVVAHELASDRARSLVDPTIPDQDVQSGDVTDSQR